MSSVQPAAYSSNDLAERLRRHSDRICSLILYSDLPWIDVELEINAMRNVVEDEAPEQADLFERLYAARFRRIRDQWREAEDYSW